MSKRIEITIRSKVERVQSIEVPQYFKTNYYICKLLDEDGNTIRLSMSRPTVFASTSIEEMSTSERNSIEPITEEEFKERRQEIIETLKEL